MHDPLYPHGSSVWGKSPRPNSLVTLDVLSERGYRPYFLISVFEEEQLRRQFGFSSVEDGPGTLVARMSDPEELRLYDPLRLSGGRPDTMAPVVPCPCGIAP